MPLMFALLLVLGGQQVDSPEAIVSRLWAQYSDRLARADVDALADLFTLDCRLMEAGADDLVGRAIIKARLKLAFAQRTRPVDLRMMPRDVDGYDGIIYDQGDFVETMAPQGQPRRAFDTYGRYFAVWTEQPDGTWKIARLMFAPKKQPGG